MRPNATQLNVPGALAQARELHRQGRLADAERLYAAILAVKPDQFGKVRKSVARLKTVLGEQTRAAAADVNKSAK